MNPSDFLRQLGDLPSGESPIREKEFMAMLGSMLQGADLSLAALMSSHPALCNQLAEFSLFSALRYIGGLETVPELQKAGLRLCVLLHLAHVCCQGNREAGFSDVEDWLECLSQSPAQLQEDPPEDVFIGYICSPEGGFRVFPGLISHADFILERLLRFLIEKSSNPTLGKAADTLVELLKLSEAIADELELPRYFSADEDANNALSFPYERNAETHARAVVFSRSRLNDLQIDPEKLSPFVIKAATFEKLADENMQGSSIERFPLFEQNSNIVVSSPALLCRAGVKFVLDTVATMGAWVDTHFENESADYFINEIIPPLGIKPIDRVELPKPSLNLPPLHAFAGQFDYGMPVLALTRSSALTNGSDLEELENLDDDQVTNFTEYLSDCCKTLEEVESFKGGMVLVALSVVGRAIEVALHDLRPEWRLFSASLADWQTLAGANEFDARRLWYLGLQEKMVEEARVRLINMGGLVTLYGYWKERGFILIPVGMDLKESDKMMNLDVGFSRTVNNEFKTICDRHSRWHPVESCSYEIQRADKGLNPDVRRNLRYVDQESARQGILRGCVVLESNAWWVEVSGKLTVASAFELSYRFWDCVMSWCERMMLHMAARYPTWMLSELVTRLSLPEVDEWNLDTIPEGIPKPNALRCQREEGTGHILLTIEESFLTSFSQAKNTAERAIVTALVNSFVVEATVQERRSIILEILRNEDTKFFHVLRAKNLESVLGNGRSDPLLVPEEEFWRASIGLAFKVSASPPEKIYDAKEAIRFLGDVVAKLQEGISGKLKRLAILPVVSQAFSQLDELSRDSARWDSSMRALLALENNADWLVEHLRAAKGELAKAEIGNRILIETACYSCVSSAGAKPSQTEVLSMLAEISVMIQLAEYRDAIANGLVEVNLTIHPNGQIEFSDSFREEVMQPYLTSRVDDGIHHQAESYGDRFDDSPREGIRYDDSKKTLEKFERAFVAEYGFGLASLNKMISVFSEFAIKTRRAHGAIDEALLIQILRNGVGFNDKQIGRVFEKFVLPLRANWNKNLPKGCEINDVLPWRFFRGLSVLVRPIVEISRSPRKFAVSVTHLNRWRTYLVQSISYGELPDRIFESTEMKTYLGDLAQKEGLEFEQRVAAEFIKFGMSARQGVKMRELGKTDADPSDDIDVIAWDHGSKSIFVVECKNLKRALTVAQAIQQLEGFRGDPDNSKDYLTKHLFRVEWLVKNPRKVSQVTGISAAEIRWKPLLITNGRVPMSYCDLDNFNKEDVWPFSEIGDKITALNSLD